REQPLAQRSAVALVVRGLSEALLVRFARGGDVAALAGDAADGGEHEGDGDRAASDHTLNRKCTTSPSWITYSLPSIRSAPASLHFASLPYFSRSSQRITSARMKPRSMSLWILPAARGASVPRGTGHARHSSGPAVSMLIRSISANAARMKR